MSREFTRTKFTYFYGKKITETDEVKKMSFVVSLAKKYDLAAVFLLIPIFLLVNQPAFILYFVLVAEVTLFSAELFLDLRLFLKKK